MSLAIAREVPCKRSVAKEKDVQGAVETIPTYIMTMTLGEAIQTFKNENPDIKLGFTFFRKLKPKKVGRVTDTNRRTRLCQVCCNFALKYESQKKLEGEPKWTSKKEMADAALCPYERWPQAKCLCRECRSWLTYTEVL